MTRIAVCLTFWGYPFGGGEAMIRQTLKWNQTLGYDTYWLSFAPQGNVPYGQFNLWRDKYGTHLHIPGGWRVEVVSLWLRWLRPVFVHHQGIKHLDVVTVCHELRIPVITGFNFWHDAVELSSAGNVEILAHAAEHREHPDLQQILEKAVAYAASDFMCDVVRQVTGKNIPHVLYSTPSAADCVSPQRVGRYVTMVNCHRNKGGDVLLHVMQALPEIPFLVLRTENHSEDLDLAILDYITERNKTHGPPSRLEQHCADMKSVYGETKILLVPSHCDETFCRVAVEALLNGIPILTSGHGNLRYIMGEAVVPLDQPGAWVSATKRLWYEEELYVQASAAAVLRSNDFREDVAQKQYESLLALAIGPPQCMFFTAWNDQGLGYQSKSYVRVLQLANINTHIFAYRPYFSTPENPRHQCNAADWTHDSVYYSTNTRENVTDSEIVDFVRKHNITVCVVPETVNERIFRLAKLLRQLNVRSIAIPNIEIVRRDEIMLHKYFDLLLYNNRLCEHHFQAHGFTNGQYLGYAMEVLPPISKNKSDVLRILAVGGMNAFSRKQVDVLVLAAVEWHKKHGTGLQVTVTVQSGSGTAGYEKISGYGSHPAVRIITEHLTEQEVEQLHEEADVYFMQSKKEGLGLGFFKALQHGLPTISLDVPPHNEIVVDGVNGFLMPAKMEPMLDNPDSLLQDAVSNAADLLVLLERVVETYHTRDAWLKLLESLGEDTAGRLNWTDFCVRLQQAVIGVFPDTPNCIKETQYSQNHPHLDCV